MSSFVAFLVQKCRLYAKKEETPQQNTFTERREVYKGHLRLVRISDMTPLPVVTFEYVRKFKAGITT